MKLIAHYFSWNLKSCNKPLSEVRDALDKAGLDRNQALDIASADAFGRACRKLEKDRVVRRVSKDKDTVVFQFTKEIKNKDGFEYDKEALLTLMKKTGSVRCDENRDLANIAQDELDKCIMIRTGGDSSKIVRRLFKNEDKGMFSCEECFGLYCVPISDLEFLNKVEAFILSLGGATKRIPVYNDELGSKSVAKDILSGLDDVVESHFNAIEELDMSTRDATLERHIEKIKATRYKVEGFQEILKDRAKELKLKLDEAAKKLRAKVEEIHKDRHEEKKPSEAAVA
jgi:uncharacterized protein DUF6744